MWPKTTTLSLSLQSLLSIRQDDKVVCPRTKEVFNFSQAEKVYIMWWVGLPSSWASTRLDIAPCSSPVTWSCQKKPPVKPRFSGPCSLPSTHPPFQGHWAEVPQTHTCPIPSPTPHFYSAEEPGVFTAQSLSKLQIERCVSPLALSIAAHHSCWAESWYVQSRNVFRWIQRGWHLATSPCSCLVKYLLKPTDTTLNLQSLFWAGIGKRGGS